MLIYHSGILLMLLLANGIALQDEEQSQIAAIDAVQDAKADTEASIPADTAPAEVAPAAIAEIAADNAAGEEASAEESVATASETFAPVVEPESLAPVPATWSIRIRPAAKVPKDYRPSKSTAVQEDASDAKPVSSDDYARVYNSIPFNRAEYNANPSYRHDATMEFMFGELRPTTIIRQAAPLPGRTNDLYDRYYIQPFRYNRNLQGSRDINGLDYRFYFPAWNARSLY